MCPNYHSPKLCRYVILRGKAVHSLLHTGNTIIQNRVRMLFELGYKVQGSSIWLRNSRCRKNSQTNFGCYIDLFQSKVRLRRSKQRAFCSLSLLSFSFWFIWILLWSTSRPGLAQVLQTRKGFGLTFSQLW